MLLWLLYECFNACFRITNLIFFSSDFSHPFCPKNTNPKNPFHTHTVSAAQYCYGKAAHVKQRNNTMTPLASGYLWFPLPEGLHSGDLALAINDWLVEWSHNYSMHCFPEHKCQTLTVRFTHPCTSMQMRNLFPISHFISSQNIQNLQQIFPYIKQNNIQ